MSEKRVLSPAFAFGLILCLVGAVVLMFFAVSTTTTTGPTDKSAAAAASAASAAKSPWLPAERIKEIQDADRDLLGDQILARKDDPSFEMLAELMPGMVKPREAVGVKHHPHDIGVAPDGTIELADDVDAKGAPVAFFEVGNPGVRFGAAPAACVKSLVDRFLPIVQARWENGGVLYTETAFGWSEGMSPDADLWAYAELEAQNMGTRTVRTMARLKVEPAAAVNPAREWKLTLKAGASRKIQVRIPWAVQTAAAVEAAPADYEKAYGEAVAFWKADLAGGLRIDVPEPRVNDAARAWLAYASLDVDKKNGVLEPHDGAGFYEEIYGYSAALYPHALDLWGRHEEAARVLESLLTFQQPDGLFTSHFGTPDPGTLLFAIWQHYELTGDAAFLKRVAPNMIRMADWIVRKRKETMTPAGAARTSTYGLIKFSPYCDFQTPCFDYFGDTYCAVGLEKTALALAAAGMKDESARIGREASAYRKDLVASMDAAVIERDGRKILPMEPETLRLLKDGNYGGGDYYGLIASCMLESELLPAADKRAELVMRHIEEKGGLRLGMAEFDGGVDHAYTYGYWLNCLKLGRVKPVLLGFYGSLAFGMSRETYAGVEVTHLLTGANEPTLPHLYSCTEQLRLLRMMLLREEGGELTILPAAPFAWLENGKAIRIDNAPTRFGDVSYAIESKIDEGKILIGLKAPAREAAKKIVVNLRRPGETPIKGVTVDGKAIKTFKADSIELANPRGEMKIEVAY